MGCLGRRECQVYRDQKDMMEETVIPESPEFLDQKVTKAANVRSVLQVRKVKKEMLDIRACLGHKVKEAIQGQVEQRVIPETTAFQDQSDKQDRRGRREKMDFLAYLDKKANQHN